MTQHVCALMIGRAGSVGFPGKNLYPLLGRPMAAYPLLAAKESKHTSRVYVSTDSPELMKLGKEMGAELIDRPAELATKEAKGEDVFVHGYREIAKRLADEGASVEFMVLLHANAPTISGALIDKGVEILRENAWYDSATSVSVYNMWSPVRARKVNAEGCLVPFVPFEAYMEKGKINCDRDSQGDVYFADMSVSVVRPLCLDNLDKGLLPQKWMGRRIAPIPNWGGLDVDMEYQLSQAEYWLKKNGVTPA